jgi:hypothetical protein
MSAIPFEEDREEHWQPEDDPNLALPGRPRRQFFNRRSAALFAVIACAAGFYAGIRVEKGQVSSSTATGLPSLAGLGARSATAGTGSRTGSASGFPAGGFALPGGSNSSIGTVKSVSGSAIYISDSSGNTVKVTLSSATKITKSLSVSKRSVYPGDSVVIRGLKNKNGTLAATAITDSGASSTSGTSGSSGSGGSSAVSSLFNSGSGG